MTQGVLISVSAIVYIWILVSDRIGACVYRPFSTDTDKWGKSESAGIRIIGSLFVVVLIVRVIYDDPFLWNTVISSHGQLVTGKFQKSDSNTAVLHADS